jgi:general secretion pathway protein E
MLGIEPMTMGCIRHAIAKTHGVVLLTGPTGSGKTTTMYSLALELQNRGRNVVSVEDPVEIPIPGMVQVQVREQQGLEYPKAIRSVLRHDPDIILIGEIRDPASAQIAMSVGSTGHLTISSVHVGSALQVLERFRSFDIAPRDAAHAISLVLNQRLLPKLCDACKIIDETAQGRFSSVVYRETGCDVCQGSGFSGRVLLTEALDLQSYRVKEIFSRTVSINEALSELPSSAVIPWYRSLEHHLLKGHISPRQLDLFVDSEMAAD